MRFTIEDIEEGTIKLKEAEQISILEIFTEAGKFRSTKREDLLREKREHNWDLFIDNAT